MACAQFIVGARGCAGEWGNFNIMNTMLKDNTSFDLKHLFIGSEGALGGSLGRFYAFMRPNCIKTVPSVHCQVMHQC